MPDDEQLNDSQIEADDDEGEDEDSSYTKDIEGFVWLTDEGEGYFLTGNEAFREEIEAVMSNVIADFEDQYSNAWYKRKRGLWFITGQLAYENEDDMEPGWDIVATEPTPDILRKFKDQLTWTRM